MPSYSTYALPAAAFFSLTIYLLITYYLNYTKLRAFKGPFFASISELWLLGQSLHANVHNAEVEGFKKYGSPLRMGPNLLCTDDPELLRHINAPKSSFTRSGWFDGVKFGAEGNHVFSERDEKRHAYLRSRVGSAYSGKGVDNLESSVIQHVTGMIALLRRSYVNKKAVDMGRLSLYFTLDVLSEIAFGKAFGYLDADQDLYEYIKTSQEYFPMLELICINTNIRSFTQSRLMQALLAPKGTDKVGFGRITGIAQAAIAKRYQPGAKQKRDMLGSFIEHGLTKHESENEGMVQIIAGSDSTAGVFRTTLLYLVSNPRCYSRLQAEIDEGVLNGTISEVITDAEARRLPYLQAVIHEGIRKVPPLFGLVSKVVPPQGETVNGTYFPGGTEIGQCLYAMTHRSDIFGDDAELFRPERWLDANEETRRKYQSTVDLVFGSGRYGCLGKNIAMLELNKVYVELLRHFDWSIPDPLKPVSEARGHQLWIHKDMKLTVTEREKR